MEKEYKGSYKGTPIIEGDWVAIVDIENKAIVHIVESDEQAREILVEDILPSEEDDWLSAHPRYKVPKEVSDAIKQRFIITNCCAVVATGSAIIA